MRQLLDRLPEGPFENVVLMPFGKLGGSDFVAGVLCHALSECGRTIILRTEQSDWARPDWYPEDVATIDLSEEFDALQNPIYALYVLLQTLAPRRVYNVNSRLAFETLSRYGRRLARQCELYAYYFCADRDEDGIEAGYPVWYFAGLLPHLTAALVDSLDLTLTLRKRYALPTQLGNKISTVYTPAMQPIPDDPVSRAQIANRQERETPRILWAGRLDRQKRFDILVDVATAMPDVEFLAWGKAVLDKPPSLSGLPKNLKLQEPFSNYDELPLDHCDGWLYTADWDGMPTILIECAAIGMPIVASAVGGIPELIDETTGWPVPSGLEAEAYVVALRDMLSDTDEALKRSSALQRRTRERHNMATYRRQILALQSEE
jgi:glycosyltransferase involved in cell wall biosynthesis